MRNMRIGRRCNPVILAGGLRRSARWPLLPGLLMLAPLAGCAGAKDDPEQPQRVTIRVVTVAATRRAETIGAVGTIGFRRELSLSFAAAGRVSEMTVDEGQLVSSGQLLASLDRSNVDADVSRAAAEMARGSAELERSKRLYEQGWVTRARLDSAQAVAAAARATLQSARFQAAHARIVAPFAGVVLRRLAEPSENVQSGQAVVRLGAAGSGMVLRVALTERNAARLALGVPAVVTIPALDDLEIRGSLIELAGIADPATGTFDGLVSLPARPGLRAGQVSRVVLTGHDGTAETMLPVSAVFGVRAGEGLAYVLDGPATVRLRRIVIRGVRPGGIAITSGIAAGERVVVSGVEQLRDGKTVVVARDAS